MGETMRIEIMMWNSHYVARTGRRIGNQSILMRFTTLLKKCEVFQHDLKLAGSDSS